MRDRLPGAWRNIVLLYLGLFLIMSAWGTTSSILRQRAWPVTAVDEPGRKIPAITEILGLWPRGGNLWRRLLQLGLPGLSSPRPRRLTVLPGDGACPASVWPA